MPQSFEEINANLPQQKGERKSGMDRDREMGGVGSVSRSVQMTREEARIKVVCPPASVDAHTWFGNRSCKPFCRTFGVREKRQLPSWRKTLLL